MLRAQTVDMCKLATLDWIGSAVAGGREQAGLMSLTVIKELGGYPQATLVAAREKTSCLHASLGNGICSHIVEMDDVHRTSILHAGAVVIPAALSVAEMRHATGREFIAAIAIGYEIAVRVGEAVTPSHYHYWHTTGTCGTFGSAAAAAKLLGLERDQLIWTLGNAGTQAAGLWEFLVDGAMSKHLHAGKAAMNGVLAALMARQGFTGARKILEGEKGFCRAMAPSFDLDLVTSGLGNGSYKVEENSFKIHASCRHTHPAIDAVLAIRVSERIPVELIDRVVVRTYKTALEITASYHPSSTYAAKFSLPFCLALALKTGSCVPNDFTRENLEDDEIKKLMSKVEMVLDEDLNAKHPALWPAVVEVTTSQGRVYRMATDYPKGDPENPASKKELISKFRTLSKGSWEEKDVINTERTVLNLEELGDMTKLFEPIMLVEA